MTDGSGAKKLSIMWCADSQNFAKLECIAKIVCRVRHLLVYGCPARKKSRNSVDDHSKAADDLKQIASSKGIQVPDKLSAKDRMTKDRLSKLSGEQFDRAYMSDMVKDHTQDVADFKLESSSGTDPDVKHFAATTLPTLQDHLRQAKEIAPTTRNASNNMKGGAQ